MEADKIDQGAAGAGTLFLVATPIGNLEDLTLRALRILGEVDVLFAEDTRRTGILLAHHGVGRRSRSLHAHNERRRSAEIVATLASGRSVALVADAGSPLISDPGAELVGEVVRCGHPVVAIPGPSALVTALSVAGFGTVPAAFLGFLPRRPGPRRRRLEAYCQRPEVLVLFESPRRLVALLTDAAAVFGPRRACVARELTKVHEEVVRGELADLAARFASGVRGEITLVIEGASKRRPSPPNSFREDRTEVGARSEAEPSGVIQPG